MQNDNYFDSKEFKENLEKYEDAVLNGISVYLDSDELADIAEYYHIKGNTKQAVEVIDYAVSLFPGATSPLVFKASLALLKEHDIEKAYRIIDLIDDKTDLDYYYIKAEIMIVENDIDKADGFLKEKFDIISEDEKDDYIIDVATLFADYEIMDKAEEWLKMVAAKDTIEYKEVWGRILFGKGDYDESERIFNDLIDSNPYSSIYWNRLASSQFMHNNIQDSITSSEYSIAINPDDDEAILNKANGLFSLGNYEEALEYYKRFTKLNKTDETGEMFQGITLMNLNRLQEAVIHLKEAERLVAPQSPNRLEIYQELAFLLNRLGDTRQAIEYIDKTDEMECDHNEMTVLRGHIMLENGNMEEAQKYFQKAIKDSELSPKVFLKIAISIYDNSYKKMAYKLLKTLLETVNDDWNEGYAYLARCCLDLGKHEEFMKYLKIATDINPNEAKTVLSDLFPDGMDVEDYYKAAENIN